MKKGIITSIFIYNYKLFVAYLDRTIKIINLKGYKYPVEEIQCPDIIIEMQARKHILFATTPSEIFVYDLNKGSNIKFCLKERFNCDQIKIDQKNRMLFVFSKDRKIMAFNIENPQEPKFQSDLTIGEYFDESDNFNITDIDVHQGKLFFAIRNRGILTSDYYHNKSTFSEPKIIGEINGVRLSDPQSVKYSESDNYLYIADAEKGLIVVDVSPITSRIVFHKKLPDNDFPQTIKIFYTNSIIKGKRKLYYFESRIKKLSTILDYKIGTFYTYYERLFFSTKGILKTFKFDNPYLSPKIGKISDIELLT